MSRSLGPLCSIGRHHCRGRGAPLLTKVNTVPQFTGVNYEVAKAGQYHKTHWTFHFRKKFLVGGIVSQSNGY